MVGVSASDIVSGNTDVSIVENSVVKSVLGTYSVLYRTTDNAGNNSSLYRTVVVQDLTAPVVSLNTTTPSIHTVNVSLTEYSDSGIDIVDNYDSSEEATTYKTGSINSSLLGTYTLTYYVEDRAGNISNTVYRTVVVNDTTKPEITLIGDNTVTIEYKQVYEDSGASVFDFGIDVTLSTNQEQVNVSQLGTYQCNIHCQ